MNWNAVAAIGEILGAIGVFSTLVYFGIQIRRTQLSESAGSLNANRTAGS